MYIVKNPARSRPLSSNVLRLMMLSRSAPKNEAVIKLDREYSPRDLACCAKQGEIFMEASSMGLKMEEFAPTYMMSQIAGIFDVYFCTSGRQKLFELIEVPIFLEKPATVVEAIYWIDDIISHAKEDENKSLAISKAYEAQTLKIPDKLKGLPIEGNRNTDELSYAYWLGYIYRCECLLHEESSRMVYGAFPEEIMRTEYEKLLDSPLMDRTLAEASAEICYRLDRLLVEEIWPRRKRNTREV